VILKRSVIDSGSLMAIPKHFRMVTLMRLVIMTDFQMDSRTHSLMDSQKQKDLNLVIPMRSPTGFHLPMD